MLVVVQHELLLERTDSGAGCIAVVVEVASFPSAGHTVPRPEQGKVVEHHLDSGYTRCCTCLAEHVGFVLRIGGRPSAYWHTPAAVQLLVVPQPVVQRLVAVPVDVVCSFLHIVVALEHQVQETCLSPTSASLVAQKAR